MPPLARSRIEVVNCTTGVVIDGASVDMDLVVTDCETALIQSGGHLKGSVKISNSKKTG